MMRPLIFISVLFALAACSSTPKLRTLSTDWPAQSGDYWDTTEAWTRSRTLRALYQEVLEVAVTFKSPDWRAAYAIRDAAHRGLTGAALEQRMAQAKAEMEGPWELEVMVTTWDRRENDLDRGKRSVWRVVMIDEAGNEIEPLEIIKDKRPAFTIRADYPAFGDFATAYIVRFPRTATILGPGVKHARLRMSGSSGGVELEWAAP